MRIRREVFPFLIVSALFCILFYGFLMLFPGLTVTTAALAPLVLFAVLCGYMLWFFRDPVRISPIEGDLVLAGADGVIAKITRFSPEDFSSITMLAGLTSDDMVRFHSKDILRISIFLSLFDVHVNRAPIRGTSRFLGYFPGKHLFTFEEKSSDVNQHNSILFENEQTCCLVNQIVGPLCRRVVYWLPTEQAVAVKAGDDFGMMKFGSRLDMYFPASDIDVMVKEGDRVKAGITIIAKLAGDS